MQSLTPTLDALFSPQNLEILRQAVARKAVLDSTVADLESRIRANAFGGFDDAGIQGWKDSIAAYDRITAAKKEIGRQQTEVAAVLQAEGQRNYELKIKDAFYAKALDQITQVYLKDQEEALTQAYTFIYQKDKRVSLDMVEERGKKTIQLTLHSTEGENEYEEGVEDEGFSAQTTLGTVLLVHFIVSHKLPRVIFFDESFGGHENQTLERFMTLMQQFRDVLGFRFVIVTHDRARMVGFADRVYWAQDGRYHLVPEAEVQSLVYNPYEVRR